MADRDSLDLFSFLDSLNSGDMQSYDKLDADAKKSAHPFIIMRWLCGTSNPAQIVRINTFVNPYVFSLGSEKPLLFKALAASTIHRPKRHYWLKAPGAKDDKLSTEAVKQYFGWSAREAQLHSLSPKQIMEMAEELGWDSEELKKLKKELESNSNKEHT